MVSINEIRPETENEPLLATQPNRNQSHAGRNWTKKDLACKALGASMGAVFFVGQEILFNEIADINSFDKSDGLSLTLISISGAFVGAFGDSIYSNYSLKKRLSLNLLTISGVINIVQDVIASGCVFTNKEAICQAKLLPYIFSGALTGILQAGHFFMK